MHDIYDHRNIDNLSYNELINLKKKLNLTLGIINNRKQKSIYELIHENCNFLFLKFSIFKIFSIK